MIVVAPGPSLSESVALKCRLARMLHDFRVVVVNDAYRLIEHADILYACDARWWEVHAGAVRFTGERWTTHEDGVQHTNSKEGVAERYGLNCVRGHDGNEFSTDPAVIAYGSNSGFQAVNLALLKGATRVVLVGFDMRRVNGRAHFFGEHPAPLISKEDYGDFVAPFRIAARSCRVPIVNATPGSALNCFPMVDLDDEMRRADDRLLRHGAVDHGRASAGGA